MLMTLYIQLSLTLGNSMGQVSPRLPVLHYFFEFFYAHFPFRKPFLAQTTDRQAQHFVPFCGQLDTFEMFTNAQSKAGLRRNNPLLLSLPINKYGGPAACDSRGNRRAIFQKLTKDCCFPSQQQASSQFNRCKAGQTQTPSSEFLQLLSHPSFQQLLATLSNIIYLATQFPTFPPNMVHKAVNAQF